MEIDKDKKVVEAAKAFVEEIEKNQDFPDCTRLSRVTDDNWRYHKTLDAAPKTYKDLKAALNEALNPPPPRPTTEECIKWIMGTFNGGSICDFKGKARATIDYLKEPSLQWVINTGVCPNAKLVLVQVKSGSFALCSPLDSWLRWGFNEEEKVNYFVEKYIILE